MKVGILLWLFYLIGAILLFAYTYESKALGEKSPIDFALLPDGTRCVMYKETIQCDWNYAELIQGIKMQQREIQQLKHKLSKFRGA